MSFAPVGAPLAPASPEGIGEGPARAALDTKADSVEVQLDQTDQTARGTIMDESKAAVGGPDPSAPSANELLERAAALGPMRMTWESIVLPADPVLDEKRQPHVAERRARLTRIVKVTLGACLGVCVLALVVSAISAISGSNEAAESKATAAATARTVAAKPIVPIEPLEGAKRGKARHFTPSVTTAAIVRPKRR